MVEAAVRLVLYILHAHFATAEAGFEILSPADIQPHGLRLGMEKNPALRINDRNAVDGRVGNVHFRDDGLRLSLKPRLFLGGDGGISLSPEKIDNLRHF